MVSHFLTRILAALDDGGARPAFVYRGEPVPYSAAARTLRQLHDGLAAQGVEAGEVVAIIGGNRPETVLVQLAAQLRGATVLLVGASASLPDRVAAVSAGGARTVVIDPGREPGRIEDLLDRLRPPKVLTLGPLASAPGSVDLLRDEPAAAVSVPESVSVIFTSGGTTGAPKLIGHSGIYEEMAYIFRPGEDPPNRALLVAPMSHMTGNAAVLGALLRGDVVVLHDDFDATAVLRAIEAERITTLSLTPPRLAQLLDHPGVHGADLSSVRALSLGASPLPAPRMRQALEVFGPVVGQGYGLTEAPMITSISAAELRGHPHRLDSVGRIVPGMEARIEGAAATGDAGEVLVRGLALMTGYHGRPGLTAASMPDGWLRTGDLGRFDDEGYLYLLDRTDDVIITGDHGTKVYSNTVESVLSAHPLVRQAAVFGVPGPGGEGSVVRAVVVPERPGALREQDVTAHARAVFGQEHSVPDSVEFTDSLPLTPIGKVDKVALRDRHRQSAGERYRARCSPAGE
jgi:acyl-CoA synthetase (AMP-forming)/AMP-acid ligase II